MEISDWVFCAEPMSLISIVMQMKGKDQEDLIFTDDAKLVESTLKGNNRGFESLVRKYQKLVYNVIYQLVRDHQICQDLTQETFLKAYRALEQYDSKRSFKPWLLKISTNCALTYLNKTVSPGSLNEILEENPQLEPRDKLSPDSEIESDFAVQELLDALLLIPVRQRQVFILRYQHDLTYEDICEITGLSLSTVKSLLFRARENLKQKILDKSNHEK